MYVCIYIYVCVRIRLICVWSLVDCVLMIGGNLVTLIEQRDEAS